MAIATKFATALAQEDSAVLLRALRRPRAAPSAIAAANAEMDRAGPVGLTVTFKQIELNTSSEGLLGKLFGKRGTMGLKTFQKVEVAYQIDLTKL